MRWSLMAVGLRTPVGKRCAFANAKFIMLEETMGMKSKLIVLCLTLLGTSLAAPFLGSVGERKSLEQKFLHTEFCKTFRCKSVPDFQFYSVFNLANGIEIRLDHCCQHAGGLFVDLEPNITLSAEKIRTLKALIRDATNQSLEFDVLKNCSSIAAIKASKKMDFYLKPGGRWGAISCVEDTTGIPEGQEYTAPEWTPSYYFSIVLPV
jgi:hypothetical protein